MSAAAREGAEKTPFLRTSNVLWDEIDLTKVDEMAIPPHELRSSAWAIFWYARGARSAGPRSGAASKRLCRSRTTCIGFAP